MKKSKKIVLLLVAIVAIIFSFVGGQSYAKYMSKVTGKGTADIASWSFRVNENEEKMQTISLKSRQNNPTLLNNKIAPGTEGEFQIKLDATGADVGINYAIRFENETKKPTNLKFTYDGKKYNSLNDLQKDLTGIINADEQEKSKTLTIGWNWKYETGATPQEISASDLIDTKEAKEIKSYTFDIVISGIQVTPDN